MPKRKSKLRLETDAMIRDAGKVRKVIIEFYPGQGDALILRGGGMRIRHAVSISDLYYWAARKTAELARQEKRKRKR